jgi:hypothetical protein
VENYKYDHEWYDDSSRIPPSSKPFPFQEYNHGSKNILVMLHMEKGTFWVVRQKPGYLEHTTQILNPKNA